MSVCEKGDDVICPYVKKAMMLYVRMCKRR